MHLTNNIKQLNTDILRLAVPSILANLTIPLVGIVDTAIAGHIADAAAIGGVAVGSMLFDLLYWSVGFLRLSTSGLTAQAYGSKNQQQIEHTLAQSLFMAACAALLFLLLQVPFIKLSLALIPCSEGVRQFATDYFYIRIWASPATLALMAAKGWLIGMQNTKATMLIDLTVNLVNMIFSYLIAVSMGKGVIGIAYGTLIAQYSGFIVAAIILIFRYHITLDFRSAIRWRELKTLLVLNKDLFLRSVCFMLIYVGFTSLSSKYGDTELAVSSIIMRLFMVFSYFIDGFAYAAEAMVGRFIGMKDNESLSLTIKILLVWTLCLGIITSVIYGLLSTHLVGFMTSEVEVVRASQQYAVWFWLMPMLSCLAFLYDGILIGATLSKELRNSMILAAIGFVVTYLLLKEQIGMQALYLAYFIHLAIRSIYLTIKWHNINNITSTI